jgi:hypothetical protein
MQSTGKACTLDTAPAEQLIDALVQQDFARFAGCFQEGCRIRAFTPNHVFGSFGPDAATITFRNWFGDAERLALVEQTIEPVGDRLRVQYLLDVTENEERTLCEQVAYLVVADGQITDLNLICSGHWPFVEAEG